jgi:hypothetical protein
MHKRLYLRLYLAVLPLLLFIALSSCEVEPATPMPVSEASLTPNDTRAPELATAPIATSSVANTTVPTFAPTATTPAASPGATSIPSEGPRVCPVASTDAERYKAAGDELLEAFGCKYWGKTVVIIGPFLPSE